MRDVTAILVVLTLLQSTPARSENRTLRAPPSPSVRAAPSLVLATRVDRLGFEAFEPMIAQDRGGTLFIAGQGGRWSSDSEYAANRSYWDSQWRARLWMSRNHGANWTQVALGSSAAGDIGNSDVDLAVAPDGTLYFASMKWDDSVREGRAMAVGVSHDAGATWAWTKLSTRRFDDRPWVVVAPDGTAHLIWNDDQGVQYVVSRDRGKTWSSPARIYDHAGSSHFAVGPRGELAVRLIPWSASHNFLNPGADLIAISTDAGSHWKTQRAPGDREWGTWAAGAGHGIGSDGVQQFSDMDKAKHRCCSGQDVPRWIEPLAWDAKGRLYSLWTERAGVWLARSADRGTTWNIWQIAKTSSPGFFPYLVARGDGELAATWHSGKGDALRWQAATIKVGSGASAPRVAESPLLKLATFNWGDSARPSGVEREPAGEYLPVTFLRGGGIGIATPIQDTRAGRVGFTYWRFDVR
jgi:hypothetical protein